MVRFFRTLLAVVRREMHEWRLAWVASAVLSAFAFATPWLPLYHQQPADLGGAVAFGTAILMSGVLTLLLGSRLVSRDLAEGRLAFYFARPISPMALWFGRLIGALTVLLVADLLILGPALIAHLEYASISLPEQAFSLTATTEATWAGDYSELPKNWGLPGLLAGLLAAAILSLILVR